MHGPSGALPGGLLIRAAVRVVPQDPSTTGSGRRRQQAVRLLPPPLLRVRRRRRGPLPTVIASEQAGGEDGAGGEVVGIGRGEVRRGEVRRDADHGAAAGRRLDGAGAAARPTRLRAAEGPVQVLCHRAKLPAPAARGIPRPALRAGGRRWPGGAQPGGVRWCRGWYGFEGTGRSPARHCCEQVFRGCLGKKKGRRATAAWAGPAVAPGSRDRQRSSRSPEIARDQQRPTEVSRERPRSAELSRDRPRSPEIGEVGRGTSLAADALRRALRRLCA